MLFQVGEHYDSDLLGGFTIHRISGHMVAIRFDDSGDLCRYSQDFLLDTI